MRLAAMFDSLGIHPKSLDQLGKMELSTWETFLLTRLVRNLKGSQVDCVLNCYTQPGGCKYLGCSILQIPVLGFHETCFYQVTKLFEALEKEGKKKNDDDEEEEEEEAQTLINHEEREQNSTEMTTVVIENVTD